jgi:prepilin-type N-terminal cleavage/methylation domain-containing protein
MQTRIRDRYGGFTLVEIMIVVAIIGLLAAIAVPNFLRARQASQASACINNLRLLDGAKQQWALEGKRASTVLPAADGSDLRAYLGRGSFGELPSCPLDSTSDFTKSYTLNQIDTAPVCNIDAANHLLPR